jgi:hypothetical protein
VENGQARRIVTLNFYGDWLKKSDRCMMPSVNHAHQAGIPDMEPSVGAPFGFRSPLESTLLASAVGIPDTPSATRCKSDRVCRNMSV